MHAALSLTRGLLSVSLFVWHRFQIALADSNPALPTFEAMVASIEAGSHAHIFFDGEGIFGSGDTEEHSVGLCILDKAGALLVEESHTFLNEWQADVAACCTKGNRDWCVGKLNAAYDLMSKVAKMPEVEARSAHSELASAVGHLLAAARELLVDTGASMEEAATDLLNKCIGFPQRPCKMEELDSRRMVTEL